MSIHPHTKQGLTSLIKTPEALCPCCGVGAEKEYITLSPAQTKNLGSELAREILKKPRSRRTCPHCYAKRCRRAFVIGLESDLGGGKTTFLQGFAKGLGIKEKVLSPTFILMRRYKIQDTRYKMQNFYHIDCYRIEDPKEILNLGFKKIVADPKNIIAIEWAEKIKKILPKQTLWLKFEFKGKNKRKIVFHNLGVDSWFCF